jgi:1-acyl-sn-glycerol-3-phosphate acyltransferase
MVLPWLINLIVKIFFRTVCRIHFREFERVPAIGPLILAGNHTNFVEAPAMLTHLYPRKVAVLSKIETWDHPALGFLFDKVWEGIPIRRGEADREGLKLSLDALSDGKLLAIAPEGTRSGDGILQKGQAGIILLALRSDTPILPISAYGHQEFWENLRRLRRTDLTIRVGTPFMLNAHGEGLSRSVREQMVDEIMYQLAALLPSEYRGVYSDLSKATTQYLVFERTEDNNLLGVNPS